MISSIQWLGKILHVHHKIGQIGDIDGEIGDVGGSLVGGEIGYDGGEIGEIGDIDGEIGDVG